MFAGSFGHFIDQHRSGLEYNCLHRAADIIWVSTEHGNSHLIMNCNTCVYAYAHTNTRTQARVYQVHTIIKCSSVFIQQTPWHISVSVYHTCTTAERN